MVAGLDPLDALADGHHGAGPLVPEEVWKKFILPLCRMDLVELGTADPAVMDLDMDLAE